MPLAALLEGSDAPLKKGKAIVAYAEALKAGTFDALHTAHDSIAGLAARSQDPDLIEIAGLIQKHPAY